MSEEIDHIAELEKRLYARDPDAVPQRKFGILRPLKTSVDSSWGANELPKDITVHHTNVSPYKKLFIGSLIFFLIGLGVALFSIYRGAVTLSSRNVEVAILGNSFVGGGESLPLQVDIANKNADDLIEATLTLAYPRGASTLPGDTERIKKELGTIGSGKTKTEAFSVVLYGEQGTSRDITAILEYKLAGSNATFVKEKTVSVMISTSPVTLAVDAPTASASGQPFSITIRTTFTGDATLENTIARIEYPNGFSFLSASPTPTAGNNTWDLKDMIKGTERIITIRGRLTGEEQDEKTFRVYIGQRTSDVDARISVSYNSTLKSVLIAQPFISATIDLGENTTDVVAIPQGTPIAGTIKWTNNTALDIAQPIFTLGLISDEIDVESINASGAYYDALSGSIIWSSASNPSIETLNPGESGSFPFSFSLKSGIVAAREVGLALSVKGAFPQRDFFEEAITNIDQKTVRFASRIQFSAQPLYSIGAIKNTGPYPSQVNKETTYTLLWTIRPAENALTGVTATATLPEGVEWTGVVAPQSEAVAYTPETRTVTWTIGSMGRATAITQTRSVAFQVKVKPTLAQVGGDIRLLNQTTIQAFDTGASVPISTTRPEVTNRLGTDPIYSPGEEKVLP
jgi:hypothetical protein